MMMIAVIIMTDIERRSSRLCAASSLRCELSPRALKWSGRNRVQVTCSKSGAIHVQHARRVVPRDSLGVKFDILTV